MLVAPASKNSTTASPFIQKPSRHGLPELFIWEQPCYETQVRKIQKRMDRENETGSKVKADWACHYFPTSPPLHVTSGTNHAFILKNHFPFLQIFTIFSGQLGWSLVQSLVELFLQFQIEEMKVSCVSGGALVWIIQSGKELDSESNTSWVESGG